MSALSPRPGIMKTAPYMPGKDSVDRGTKAHDASTAFQRFDDERQDHIVQAEIGHGARDGFIHGERAPMHQASTPFCA